MLICGSDVRGLHRSSGTKPAASALNRDFGASWPGGHFYGRRGWSPLLFPFQLAPCPPALFCIGGDLLLGALSIFQACCRLNQGSSRQCPLDGAVISSSLLAASGGLAMARVSWGPARPPRGRAEMALPVAPAMSETAPCTRTFICSRLFGIPPTQSRASPDPAPASAACRPLAGERLRDSRTASWREAQRARILLRYHAGEHVRKLPVRST